MAERQGFIDRIKATEREYYVVAAAVARFTPIALDGHADLPPGTSRRDLIAAADQGEATYLIRMWAEFETALRSYYCHKKERAKSHINAGPLVNWSAGIKQGRAISEDARDHVHEVREYRNFLVHERDNQAPPAAIHIQEARRRLNTFLHCLPDRW